MGVETTEKRGRPWLSLAVLVVLMGVALALRWRYVRDISLFVDEFVTTWAARGILAHGLPIFPSGNFYPHGITFTYLEAPFVAGAFDERLARVPGVLVGLAILPAAYYVGRRMLSDTAGLAAAAALAVDPEAITWGARARMYGLLQLLVLVALYFFYHGLAGDRPRDRAIGMVLLAAAILTHAEAIFLLPILGLAALVFWPWRRLLRWSVALPFVAGAAGAVAYYLLARFGQPGHLETIEQSRPYLAVGLDTLLSGTQVVGPVFMRAYRLPFTVLALAGLYYLLPPRFDRRSALTYLWVVFGAFTLLLVFLAGATWQNERYFFVMLPLLFLLAGETLNRLAAAGLALLKHGPPRSLLKRTAALAPALAVAVALFGGLAGSRHAYVQVWGYDRAFRALHERFHPTAGDRVVTPMPSAAALYLGGADYFLIQSGYEEFIKARPGDGVPADLWTATPVMTTTAAFAALLRTAPRVWLVADGWRLQTRYTPDLIQAVVDHMTRLYDDRGVMILRAEGYAATPAPALSREKRIDYDGQMVLTGFDLSAARPRPGEALDVTLHWQAGEGAGPAYTAFLHLVAADGTRVAGIDEPVLKGLYQPDLWPRDWTAADRHRLALPADLPPGRYRLDLGLYYPGQADRPLAVGQGTRAALTYLTVGEPTAVSPPSHPVTIAFGDAIRLDGYDLDCGAGASCRLDLHWQALAPMDADYKVFVHLLDPSEQIAAQDDRAPGGDFYPTSAWLPGDTLVSAHSLALLPGAAKGGFRVLAGIYDPATNARLPATGPGGRALGDAVELAAVP